MKTPELQPFGKLVIEVEHEVAKLCLVDNQITARAVRVQAVGLDVVLGQRFLVAEDPAGARWLRRR